jgi:hypothetical protein
VVYGGDIRDVVHRNNDCRTLIIDRLGPSLRKHYVRQRGSDVVNDAWLKSIQLEPIHSALRSAQHANPHAGVSHDQALFKLIRPTRIEPSPTDVQAVASVLSETIGHAVQGFAVQVRGARRGSVQNSRSNSGFTDRSLPALRSRVRICARRVADARPTRYVDAGSSE